ncbi:C2 calcium-dependent domain-containing protein 4C-like [Mauremys mutica]|uniref:C2 calcium-dependent domain-containing protein 4C-like n=1 Tax=Mauremys mutica TaxID=74926 RepID=UPI001D16809A|nr:C2 calcium-dependent domain-containing protein 4C-like [Mauremys mutica]
MSAWEPARLCWSSRHGKCARDVFASVVTPDRIPQFIIPSLAIQEEHRLFRKGKERPWRPGAGQPEWKARRSSSDPAMKDGRALRGPVPCCSSAELAARVEDIPDPVARAALSLPHLPKITTPYGFVTLGESPQVTNEEALFFHLDLAPSRCPGATREQPGNCRDSGAPIAHTAGRSQRGGYLTDCRLHGSQQPSGKGRKGSQGRDQPARPPLPRRSSSPIRGSRLTDVLGGTEAEDAEGKQTSLPLETVCQRSYSSPGLPAKTKRNFFQRILKKHVAHLRHLKFRHFPLH